MVENSRRTHRGLTKQEQTGCGESTDGEETLANGVAVGGVRSGDASALLAVLDKLRGDRNLCTNITELCYDAEEELVLLSEWGVFVAGQVRALLGLEGHVCICDFGNWGEEEYNSKQEDEGSDADVSPLDLGEIVDVGV